MLYIIGIYKNEKTIVGLKIWDSKTQKIGMYYKENVLEAVKYNNMVVAGVDKTTDGKFVTTELTNNLYKVKALDQVNSKGICNDVKKYIPLKIVGFGETAIIHAIDCMGVVHKFTNPEFINLLDSGKIVGAKRASRGRIKYHKYFKKLGEDINEEQ